MPVKYGYSYKGYDLHCDPMPMADGRFGAQVAVYKHATGSEKFGRKFPALGYFATEQKAAEHGKAVGMRWVDENG